MVAKVTNKRKEMSLSALSLINRHRQSGVGPPAQSEADALSGKTAVSEIRFVSRSISSPFRFITYELRQTKLLLSAQKEGIEFVSRS